MTTIPCFAAVGTAKAELTKKQYAGTCDFGSFNGTITIYTNM